MFQDTDAPDGEATEQSGQIQIPVQMLSASCIFGMLQVLSHPCFYLSLKTLLWPRHPYTHFTDKENENLRVCLIKWLLRGEARLSMQVSLVLKHVHL